MVLKLVTVTQILILITMTTKFCECNPSPSPFLFSTGSWALKRFLSSTNDRTNSDKSTPNVEDLRRESKKFESYRNKNNEELSNNDNNPSNNPPNNPLFDDNNDDDPFNETTIDDFNKDTRVTVDEDETPGILHRKAWKVLKKLQLFSALRSSLTGGFDNVDNINNNNEESSELNFDNQNDNQNDEENEGNFTHGSYLPPFSSSSSSSASASALSPASASKKQTTTMTKSSLTTNNINKNDGFLGKLSLQNGNVGVFFMEIFASIATIFTTAAYQIQHFADFTPAASSQQPQPPPQPQPSNNATQILSL